MTFRTLHSEIAVSEPRLTPARQTGRGRRGRTSSAFLGTAGVLGAATLAGICAGAGEGLLIILALLLLGAVGFGIASWRRSLTLMLLYMPFSGVLPLLLYPHSGASTQLKDIAFVIPAYIGAMLALLRRNETFGVAKAPWLLTLAFSLLVLVEAFNPHIPKALIGPIGVKQWLFYLPLLVMGYHMYPEKFQFQRVLKWMAIVGLIPNLLGILEAILIYSGKSAFVYHLYGAAAAASTEDFTTFSLGGGTLTRVSGIFTFTAQYWFFTTAMIAVSWAAWRGNRDDRTMRWLGPLAVGVALFASMTSGLRAAFIFDPALLLVIAMLDGLSVSRVFLGAVGALAAVGLTLAALGIPLGPLTSLTSGHTSFIVGFFGQGIDFGLHHSIFGLGTGIDTNQARYAFTTIDYGTVYATTGGMWYESTYLQAFLELGVAGLVLWVAIMVAIVKRCTTAHMRIRDREARAISAAVFGLLIYTIVFSFKTTVLDDDPVDVYLWLLIGWQWRLGDLAQATLPGLPACFAGHRHRASPRAGTPSRLRAT